LELAFLALTGLPVVPLGPVCAGAGLGALKACPGAEDTALFFLAGAGPGAGACTGEACPEDTTLFFLAGAGPGARACPAAGATCLSLLAGCGAGPGVAVCGASERVALFSYTNKSQKRLTKTSVSVPKQLVENRQQ